MVESGGAIDGFFKSACLFEALLLPLAFLLGWMADIDPLATCSFSEAAIFYGIAGTLPLVLLFFSAQYASHAALRKIRDLIMVTLASKLYARHWTDLFMLSAIAGVAEEALFRGVVQPWIELHWGFAAGLMLSSVLFAVVHAITPLYALFAGVVSVYLGLALDYGGTRNLLTPIVIHGLYDFIAFLLLIRLYKKYYLAQA